MGVLEATHSRVTVNYSVQSIKPASHSDLILRVLFFFRRILMQRISPGHSMALLVSASKHDKEFPRSTAQLCFSPPP